MQLLKSTDLGRHSLLYLKEIGHGWFGKVSIAQGGGNSTVWALLLLGVPWGGALSHTHPGLDCAPEYSFLTVNPKEWEKWET